MTRQEHLKFCKNCTHRKHDLKQGIICGITDKAANFEESCPNYDFDETAKEETATGERIEQKDFSIELDSQSMRKLKEHQDFYYAVVGGLLATVISAIIWAVITVSINYQIGFMAIGVGLLVGFTIRFFGAGIEKKFGFLGAFLSLAGCLLGNLFSQVGFIAQQESLGYLETLSYLNFGIIKDIFIESFNPIDLLFYGIAIYEGYRFSFRRITMEDVLELRNEEHEGHPAFYKLRLPLVILSIILIGLFIFKISKGVSGFKTYQYESGAIMSEGQLVNSQEEGDWTYFYEDGTISATGHFTNGQPDGLWKWYSESGEIKSLGNYKNGLEHGEWQTYYNANQLSDSGSYIEGRMDGLWKFWYENGHISQTGHFKRNKKDGLWKNYYENGQLSSEGKMADNVPAGRWVNYSKNGNPESQLNYLSDGKYLTEEAWDKNGRKIVDNGNGYYKEYSDNEKLIKKGKVENGKEVGKWMTYFENGKIREEGNYKNDIYYITNSWDISGNQNITDGNGVYKNYYEDGSLWIKGDVENGLKEGLWLMFYSHPAEQIFQETHYENGKLNGMQNIYFESGQLNVSGKVIDGLREGEWTWYYENGLTSSIAHFIHDKKDGKQTMFSETGKKTKEEYYENGELINEKLFE